jgi:hypothetical protein
MPLFDSASASRIIRIGGVPADVKDTLPSAARL